MTIYGKVQATFATQVVPIAAMAAAALISYEEFREASNNLDSARQAHILQLECRRREKDFLLENDTSKALMVQKSVGELQELLQQLTENAAH
jgi:hypothetical protein